MHCHHIKCVPITQDRRHLILKHHMYIAGFLIISQLLYLIKSNKITRIINFQFPLISSLFIFAKSEQPLVLQNRRLTQMDEDYDQIPSSTADDDLSLPKGKKPSKSLTKYFY